MPKKHPGTECRPRSPLLLFRIFKTDATDGMGIQNFVQMIILACCWDPESSIKNIIIRDYL